MLNYYEEMEHILEQLEAIEHLKKNIYIPKIEEKEKFIGDKYNMLTVLEKTDKRTKNR